MTSLLSIGSGSLLAAQGSLSTIAHNIANANTPGYSRQETVLSTSGGQFSGSGFFGRGVDMTTVRRQYDQFAVAAVRSGTAQSAADTARADGLSQLDGVFSNPDLGIGAAIDAVFSAAGDLANRPSDTSARQVFLGQASQLADRVDAVGGELASVARDTDQQIAGATGQVNDKLTAIRLLNEQIARGQVMGHAPNDLLDQRDAAIQELSGLMGVNVVASGDGTVNLFSASGAPLLVGMQQATVQAVPDAADTTRTALRITLAGTAQTLDPAALGGGKLAGLFQFRNEDLASAVNQVGRLAVAVAGAFNAQQAAGVDASGVPGKPLFAVAAPVVHANTDNTGNARIAASVGAGNAQIALLKASDYRVAYDGTSYTVTRLSDGQVSSAATFPMNVDGLDFSLVGGAMASGDSFLVQPYAAAASGLTAQPLTPRELATGYAVTVQAGATNKGTAGVGTFAVQTQGAATTAPVSITFNNPPTSFNVTGLAGGNLSNVPYTSGARIPAAPADYNGWSLTLNGNPAAGDSFAIAPNTAPVGDNRNALALGALADLGLVDGATLNEAYAALIGDVGTRVQGANAARDVSGALQSEAVSRQQSVSGVNLDEEAANLLRFQQAYQASAKIIQASQSIFESLLSAVGK